MIRSNRKRAKHPAPPPIAALKTMEFSFGVPNRRIFVRLDVIKSDEVFGFVVVNLALVLTQRSEIEHHQEDYRALASHLEDLRTMCDPSERKTLNARYTECTKFLGRVCEVVSAREEALDRLSSFHYTAQKVVVALERLEGHVKSNVISTDELIRWQKESHELGKNMNECARNGSGLDPILQQAQLTTLDSAATRRRTTVRGYLNRLQARCEKLQAEISIKQEHFDEVDSIWQGFLDRKEKLLKALEDLEERAEIDILIDDIDNEKMQMYVKIYEKLKEELDLKKYELTGLQGKGKQLGETDPSQDHVVQEHLKLVEMTWEDTKDLIVDREEQLKKLAVMLRDYELVRQTVERTLSNAEVLSSAAEAPRHFNAEEVKRHVNKLESLKKELDEKQPVMDDLTMKGKLAAAEAKKQLVSEATTIHARLEELVDRYLDVGDKVEESVESLKGQLALWKELISAEEELDDWVNTSINDLNASVSSLEDSVGLQGKIKVVHEEIEKNKSVYEELQRKMNEVHVTRRRSSVGEMDELAQVNESMKAKLDKATSVYQQAQTRLEDFTTQRKMLVDYVEELCEWLDHKEQSLNSMLRNPKPEHLKKCREINSEILGQRDNVESTKEHFNSLCRKFQTPELTSVQEKVSKLTTKYEEISKLLSKVMDNLEGRLDDNFNDAVKDFYAWFRSSKEVVGACADTSGDVPALEEKLEKLQNFVAKIEEGENRVNKVVTSGEICCDAQLSRASSDSVQQQMQNVKDEWHDFLAQVQDQRSNLESSLAVLRSLEDNRKELARSLKVIERSLRDEEEPKDDLDAKIKQLETLQALNKELSGKSKQVENLMQQAHDLVEGDSSQGGSARKAQQLITMYHGLCRKAKERLRVCDQSVNDQRQYDDALASTKAWLRSATTKLDACVEATQQAVDQLELEARLVDVQSLLSSLQEGEVKLNVALGKGERASQSSTIDGKHKIHDDLTELKSSYEDLSDKLSDRKVKLSQRLADWLQYTQSRDELVTWLDENDALFAGRPALAVDLKDKEAQLEKYRLIEEDVSSHEETIDSLRNKAIRLNREGDFKAIEELYEQVCEKALERVAQLIRCVEEHASYYEASRDFVDWCNSAKEELDRWSDVTGTDKDAIQKKLQKVQSLKATRTYGRQKLDTAIDIGDHVIADTAESGRDVIKTEIESLKEEWRSWDRSLIETEISLESRLSQVTKYEESFEIERSALADALERFQSRLNDLDVDEVLDANTSFDEVDGQQQPQNTTAILKKCKVISQALNGLQESVDTLKARLNTMCRTYQGPEIDQLSKDVTAALQRYDANRLKTDKCRLNCERGLNETFQNSVREFDLWIKSKKDAVHKYGEISGDREVAQERLQHLQALLGGVDAGQTKLNAVLNTSECLLAVVGPEVSGSVRQQSKLCKDNWRNFLNALQDREQGLRNHVDQLKEFDTNVNEITEWLQTVEAKFEAESGLKATIGLKKSQHNAFQTLGGDIADHQYKYERMKRKAQKLGSSLELTRLNQLLTRYHTVTKQVQDALKRSEQHVTEHQAYQTAFTECQEWMNDFGHRMESYCNLAGGKHMLEQRLNKLDQLLASRQDGEIKLNVMLGRGEKILESTAAKGRSAIESQMQNLQDSWEKYTTQADQWRGKLAACIALWEEYDESVKNAQSWLEQAEQAIKCEKEARAIQPSAADSTFADLEKCQALYRDVKQRSTVIEKAQLCANKIAECTGDAGGTRVDTAELRDLYQDTLNAAQALLDEVESAAESAKSYHQALHIFTDWFSGRPVELFRLSDQTGGKEILAENLKALQQIEKEIPEGEEKLKQAFNAGKKSGSDKTVKLQLQNLKEEWKNYRKSLTDSLRQTSTLLDELEKYHKICVSFEDWLNAMEQCPDNEVSLTGNLQENRDSTERFRHYTDEITNNRHKLEKLNKAAQNLLETCAPSDGSMSKQVTELSSRYQSLLMKCKSRLRAYQSAVQIQSDYQEQSDEFDQWLNTAAERFAVQVSAEMAHPDTTDERCEKLDDLLVEFESKKVQLSQISEKANKLIQAIGSEYQAEISAQTSTQQGDFQELYASIQTAQRTMRRNLHLQKDYSNALDSLKSWLADAMSKVENKPEMKYELFEKKAQLARYIGYQEDIGKHQETLRDVAHKSDRLSAQSRDPRDVEQVNEKFQRVAHLCHQRIDELKVKVKSHQEYHDAVQSAEKWLLGKSSQIMMVSSQDLGESGSESSPASTVEDLLVEYRGVQEEISNFRVEVQAASNLGKKLLNEYEDGKKEPLESQIQNQLSSLQATYDTVHAAAAQLVRRLTEVVHKHQDLSVKLEQTGAWLAEQQSSIRVACAYPSANLYEAIRRVKDIALLLEDVKAREIFVEDSMIRDPEQTRPLEKKFAEFKKELESLLAEAAEAESGWRTVMDILNDFKEWLLDTEKLLHRLEDSPAEATSSAAKEHALKCKKVYDEVTDKKGMIALLDDKYRQLLGERENDDSEFHDLISQWERLFAHATNLHQSQERNLSATQDFNFYLNEVESLTQHYQSEADLLLRNVVDSTPARLERAKALVMEMQDNKKMLDALTERLDNLTPRMNAHDAEMVEDKVRHLNQRWIEAEQKLQSRAQLLESTACEHREYRRQLDATRSWLRALIDKVTDPVPMTLSVEDLNAARQKHSMLCKELNQKKEEFSELSSCHQTLPLSLSAPERDALHTDVTGIQALFRKAQAVATDKTNALNHAIGRRKDLWATSQQALAWLEHIKENLEKRKPYPLHPDAVAKLIQEHRTLHKEIVRHKVTVDEVIATGIQIIYEGKPESVSVRGKLTGLEDSYAEVDELWRHRLDELQQLLASRELFHADVDRCLRWLKEADIVTFPEVNLAASLPDLETHLGRYEAITNESVKYRDLVSKICDQAQQILSQLSDVDQSLITDKMKNIKDQFEHVCKSAEQKGDQMREMMSSRREYIHALEELEDYLGVGQTMLHELDHMPTGHTAGQARTLLHKAEKIQHSMMERKPSLERIEKMRDCLKGSGQPWQPEELLKATAIYHRLAQQSSQRIDRFREMALCRERFERRIMELDEQISDCDRELNTGSPSRVEHKLTMSQQMAAMLTSCQIELRSVSGLAEQLCADMEEQDKTLTRDKVDNLRDALHRLQGNLGERQRDLEKRLVSRRDFQGDLEKGVQWLEDTQSALECETPLKLDPQSVQEEIKKLQITKEEVESKLRVLVALGDKEVERHLEEGEELPFAVKHQLDQLTKLKASLAAVIETKERHLEHALESRQRYADCLNHVQSKLGSASAELQLLEADSNPEHARDLLEQHQALFTTEGEILHYVDELEEVAKDLEEMCGATGLTKTARDTLSTVVGGVRERAENLLDSAKDIHQSLQAAAISWEGFDLELDRVTSKMTRTEERLKAVDCSMPSSLETAQNNLNNFQLITGDICNLESSVQALQEVSQALAATDSVGGRMAVGRSLTGVKQRLTRLQGRSKEIQRILEKSVREWKTFNEVTSSTGTTLDRVQDKLPYQALEKCTLQELKQQRSTLHSLQNDVSSVSRRLSTVHDAAHTLSGRLESPIKHAVRSKAENIEGRCQKLSEATIEKMAAVKSEMQSRETLNAELRDMLEWVEDMRENADRTLDIAPAPGHVQDKLDTMRQLKEQLSNKEAHFNKISEEQRQKYLQNYAILPVELSSTIAKIRIALAALHEELRDKENELESARDLREDYHDEIMQISSLLSKIEMQVTDDPSDLVASTATQRQLADSLDQCHVRLVNLDAVAQEIADQTSHAGSKASLNAAVNAVNEHYTRVQELMDGKIREANQASVYLDELNEMGEFLDEWKSKALSTIAGPLTVSDAKDARKQMRDHKNLREQLRRLRNELERKRDRLPSSLPSASSNVFNRKIDAMLEECGNVEDQIRRHEDELGDAVAVATEMEEEVQKISDAVADLKYSSVGDSQGKTILQQIQEKKKILDRLQKYKDKLENVKTHHPYQLSPTPSPRKRGVQEAIGVPKLALDTLREPVEAVKRANDAEQAIDEVELAVTAELLDLEAQARDNDVYDDEIRRLAEKLDDVKQRLNLLPKSKNFGSSRVSTPRTPREELEEFRKLTEEMQGYEKEIDQLRQEAENMKFRNDSSMMENGLDSPPYDLPSLNAFQYSIDEVDALSTTDGPRTSTRQQTPRERFANQSPSPRSDPEKTPTFYDLLRQATKEVPISPIIKTKSPTDVKRRLALDDDLSDTVSPTWTTPDSKFLGSASNPSSCSTNSLLSPTLAKPMVSTSPDSAIAPSTDLTRDNSYTEEPETRQSLTNSPFMVSRQRDSTLLDSPDRKLGIVDRSLSKLKEQLGSKAESFLNALQQQEDLQGEIQGVTSKLDEFQDRLDASDEEVDLQMTLQATQELLDDINRLIPKLESVDRKVRFLGKDHAGKDAFQATVSVLYDRWDTIRMQATSKQNTVEIKILEEEQYRRMVEAYKAELQQVTDWMEEAKCKTSPHEEVHDGILLSPRRRRHSDSSSASSNMTSVHQQLKQCRDTVLDIERKLILLSELSGTPRRDVPVTSDSTRSRTSSTSSTSTVVSSALPPTFRSLGIVTSARSGTRRASGLPSVKELLWAEKSSNLSQADEERDALLRKLESVKGDLENLQKETQDREKQLQNELETQRDDSLFEQESRAQQMRDWLQSLETDSGMEVMSPTALQRQLSDDLRDHQEHLETVAKKGRNRSASRDSYTSPRSTDHLSPWKRLSNEAENKATESNEFTAKNLCHENHLTLTHAVDCGKKVDPPKLNKTLEEVNRKWVALNHSQKDAKLINEKSQRALKDVTQWMDQVEFDLILSDWTKETDATVQRECKTLQENVGSLLSTSKQFTAANPLAEHQRDIQSALRSLDTRLHSVAEEQRKREGESRDKKNQWRNVQVDLKMALSQLSQLKKQMKNVTSAKISATDDIKINCGKLKSLQEEIRALRKELKPLLEKTDEFACGSHPSHTLDMHELRRTLDDVEKSVQTSLNDFRMLLEDEKKFTQMLKDYKELLDAGFEKVEPRILDVLDLKEFNNQLSDLKKFALTAKACRAVCLETSASLHPTVQNQQRQLLENLLKRHDKLDGAIVERLFSLEKCTQEWEKVEVEIGLLGDDLETVESLLPEEEDVEDQTSRIHLLESLQEKLNKCEAAVSHTSENWKRVAAQQVTCILMENRCSELANTWLLHSSKVNQELRRLYVLRELQPRYSHSTSTLRDAMGEVSQKLTDTLSRLGHSSLNQHDVGTIATDVSELVRDVKRVDLMLRDVTDCCDTLTNETMSDRKILQAELEDLTRSRATVTSGVAAVQEKLLEAQIKFYADAELAEKLKSWILETNSALDKENVKNFDSVTSDDCKGQMIAYQSFQSVQNSMEGSLNHLKRVDTPRQLDVAGLNRQWGLLKDRISRCVNQSEREFKRWKEYEQRVNILQQWMDRKIQAQDEESATSKIGSRSDVTSSLRQYENFEKKLKSKFRELTKLETEYRDLVTDKNQSYRSATPEPGCGSPELLKLNQSWTFLDHSLARRKKELKQAIQQWDKYQAAENIVFDQIRTAEIALQKDSFTSENPQEKIAKLQGALRNFESQRLHVQFLAVEADCVIAGCHDDVGEVVKRKLTNIDSRWNDVSVRLARRIEQHGECVEARKEYDDKLADIENRSKSLELKIVELLDGKSCLEDPRACSLQTEGLERTCEILRNNLQTLTSIAESAQQRDRSEAARLAVSNTRFSVGVLKNIRRAREAVEKTREHLRKSGELRDKMGYMDAWLGEVEVITNKEYPANRKDIEGGLAELRNQLQAFKAYSRTMDDVNSIANHLPLGDKHIKKVQALNDRWKETMKSTAKRYGMLQSSLLPMLEFAEKCENWMLCVTQAERSLVADIPTSYNGLFDQARSYDMFIVESGARQQLLRNIISEGEEMLSEDIVPNREEFGSKLTNLDKQWSSVLRKARERKTVVDAAIETWRTYKHKTAAVVADTRSFDVEMTKHDREIPLMGLAPTTLAEIMELEASTESEVCAEMLDAGHRVMALSRGDLHARLKKEISSCHGDYTNAHQAVKDKRRELQSLVNKWNDCDDKISDIISWLADTKTMLTHDLPSAIEDLHAEAIKCRDREIVFEMSPDKLRSVDKLVQGLADVVSGDDLTLMRERLALVRALWHDVRNGVEQRRRCIETRLNDWNKFDEKYRDLCSWLNKMERKVAHASDSDAEQFLEKLQKDYLSDIDADGDRRAELVLLAERLAPSSDRNEMEKKLAKINDKWQHLEGLVRARTKKLKETYAAVAQLDTSMTDLRDWLKLIESNLAAPVIHQNCTDSDVRTRLEEQKALQQDIEKHSTGVASVLNLCEVLLHDGDACATENERQSIEEATKSLDRRWRNICALSMERRLKIEDTQRLWQKFLSDFARFGEWLHDCEATSSNPNTQCVAYNVAREELRSYETFQRKVHEGLTQLELINKQYRRLARENRTDTSNKLKQLVHDGNTRWDALSRRVGGVLRRLKHAIERRESFETLRESLLVWLTETDLQLTNLEHFSPSSDRKEKLAQVKDFQSRIEERIPLLRELDEKGRLLVEKSEQHDCVAVEEEMEDFHDYCREVIARLDRYHKRLVHLMNESDLPTNSSLFDDTELPNLTWWTASCLTDVSFPDSNTTDRDLLATPTGRPCNEDKKKHDKLNGRTSPHSIGSLEWDHYDISQSEIDAKLDDDSLSIEGSITDLPSLDGDTPEELNISTDSTIKYKEPKSLKSNLAAVTRPRQEDETAVDSAPAKRRRQDLDKTEQKVKQRERLNHDLDAVLKWLGATKVSFEKSVPTSESVSQIESKVKELKALQKEIEARKPIVLSINLVAARITNVDADEELASEKTRSKSRRMNVEWEAVNANALKRKEELQKMFVRSEELRFATKKLKIWIEEQEKRRQDLATVCRSKDSLLPIPLQTLRKAHKALIQLRVDTLEERAKIATLQDISNQLLYADVRFRSQQAPPVEGATETSDRLHDLTDRLKALLDRIGDDVRVAEGALKEERRRMRGSVGSNSETDSVASEVSLHSTTSMKLKKLRRKVETSKTKYSSSEMTKNQVNHVISTTDQSHTSTGTTTTNHTHVAVTTTLISDVTAVTDTSYVTETENTLSDVTFKNSRMRSKTADEYRQSDSDGESGYVEYETDYQALCEAINWAADRVEERGTGDYPFDVVDSDVDHGEVKPKPGYLSRAFKAALPLYGIILVAILFLLLLPLTCLDEKYVCLRQNNYHYRLNPTLAWTDGPPPT